MDIDLKGAIIGTKLAIQRMMKQGHGAIYGIEGYGSNDAMMLGLSIYGTSKRGLTYFLEATAKEIKREESTNSDWSLISWNYDYKFHYPFTGRR